MGPYNKKFSVWEQAWTKRKGFFGNTEVFK